MGTSLQRVCFAIQIILLVSASCVSGSDSLICTGLTFYRVKNGRATCKQCPCKRAGFGLDKSVKRLENEHGFLSCNPCKKCPAGTFRELDNKEPECRPCTLDCLRLNRYGSVTCEGANPGHCGDCRVGYITDSKEPGSICRLKEKRSTIVHEDRQKTPITSTQEYRRLAAHTADTPIASEFHAMYAVLVPGSLTILVILCAVAAALYHRHCREPKNRSPKTKNLAQAGDSTRALITSKDSNIGFCNDLEIDGGGHQMGKARGELPEHPTLDEIEAMTMGSGQTKLKTKGEDLKRIKWDRLLEDNDETLTIVGDNVSGEKRHELFQTYLKVEESKTDPEQELWLSKKITHSEYVLNVLKIWLHRVNKEATLEALCNALIMASFHFIVDMILDLPENKQKISEDFEKDTIEEEITPSNNTQSNIIFLNETENASLYNPSANVENDWSSESS